MPLPPHLPFLCHAPPEPPFSTKLPPNGRLQKTERSFILKKPTEVKLKLYDFKQLSLSGINKSGSLFTGSKAAPYFSFSNALGPPFKWASEHTRFLDLQKA
ncbi:ankyrin repeat domain-containing protein 9-like [Platysternon megacephalum]|uniref:Ankyrin repeat domain-containing protein 9-like n=1 Tax=Platysternon megacephalum TaxID=55544 RepID=A0A4D9EMS6_9SAUR|nr:ankyrin repeat domain-containing protein 9-like [Platysternon megacephalum]